MDKPAGLGLPSTRTRGQGHTTPEPKFLGHLKCRVRAVGLDSDASDARAWGLSGKELLPERQP